MAKPRTSEIARTERLFSVFDQPAGSRMCRFAERERAIPVTLPQVELEIATP
ncbi:hypothetical protein CLV41_104247 [Roseibium marinum]|uniref:Uncharacterized protein n=1 Tax=Roseibium marinum TaxID=281252 RepID=A0A2S3UVD2_9HYPH|nr:hypothetical protein CLV41_104247 [Roseibium marinum]